MKGGSLASSSVASAVNQNTFEHLNKMFTNQFGGSISSDAVSKLMTGQDFARLDKMFTNQFGGSPKTPKAPPKHKQVPPKAPKKVAERTPKAQVPKTPTKTVPRPPSSPKTPPKTPPKPSRKVSPKPPKKNIQRGGDSLSLKYEIASNQLGGTPGITGISAIPNFQSIQTFPKTTFFGVTTGLPFSYK